MTETGNRTVLPLAPVPSVVPPPALAPELEARIAAFENVAPAPDFDAVSWFWMIFWGIVIPLALLIVGWQA